MTSVFISYSHDSDEHRARVLGLSERLRSDGIETMLDQYVNGAPLEGWPRWMLNQLDAASFSTRRRCQSMETPDRVSRPHLGGNSGYDSGRMGDYGLLATFLAVNLIHLASGILATTVLCCVVGAGSRYVIMRGPNFVLFLALLVFGPALGFALNNLMMDKFHPQHGYVTAAGGLLALIYPLIWIPALHWFRIDADRERVWSAARFAWGALALLIVIWIACESG
jgi:hypothetical protein